MRGSDLTQPVKFLAHETPVVCLPITNREKLLTITLRLFKKVINFLAFSSFLKANLTFPSFCYCKKQIDSSFLYVCPSSY